MQRLLRTDSWVVMAAMFVLATLFFWTGNDRVSLWDRDEPRYAETAKQMRRRGDYIVPYFNDQFRFQKPVLTYWLVASSYAVFGESDFAARAVSGLCLAGVLLLMARLGDRMFGPPAGLVAAGMFCVPPMALILGKLALPDGPQLLTSTACLAAMYHCWRRESGSPKPSRFCPILFWTALAGSILVKGPIVLGMIALTFVTLWAVARIRPSEFQLGWKWGPVLTALVSLPWLAAIYSAVGPAFFSESVGNQIARRLGESFDQKFLPPGYYAATALLCLAPWTGFVLLAFVGRWRLFREKTPEAFLAAWTFGPMILLELFRSKQPHYFAPAYPAMMLLAAGYLAPVLRRETTWPTGFIGRTAGWWPAALGVGVAVALAGFGLKLDQVGAAWAFIAAAMLATSGVIGTWLLARQRVAASLKLQWVGSASALLLLAATVLPSMDPDRVAKKVAAKLSAETQPNLYVFGCIEPSFVYYGDRPVVDLKEQPTLARPIQNGEADFLVATTAAELELLQRFIGRPAHIEETIDGWLRMHKDTVHLVRFAPVRTADVKANTIR
jgi:4-amino-4-deoxy-L-arabinose transferase-like glycosyltransferase